MELTPRNYYYGQPLGQFPDGTMELPPREYVRPTNLEYIIHTVKQGERLDTIAGMYYKLEDSEPAQWSWLIFEENKGEGFEQEWDLSNLIGKEIRIPSLRQ